MGVPKVSDLPEVAQHAGDIWQQIVSHMPKFTGRPTIASLSHDYALSEDGPVFQHERLATYGLAGPIRYNMSYPLGVLGLTFKPEKLPNAAVQLLYEITAHSTPPVHGRLLVQFNRG